MQPGTKLLLLLTGTLFAVACREGDNNGTNKPDSGVPPTNFECPQLADLTVCDLKLPGGSKQPPLGDPIVLPEVVVTSPVYLIDAATSTSGADLLGFYVQDQTTTDALAGGYSGVLVTIRRGLTEPAVGDVVRVEGIYTEFPMMGAVKQKQIQGSFVGVTGTGAATPIQISDPATIATGGADQARYEGVLVQIGASTAVEAGKVAGAGGREIFGAFKVGGGLVVSGGIYEYPASVGEAFNSITGILKTGTFAYDSGISQLQPRSPADVLPAVAPIGAIAALQDPSSPGRPAICQNMGQAPTGCPKVSFRGVVVTARGAFISNRTDMATGTRTFTRGFYVQDPTVIGGRFSGVMVIYIYSEPNPDPGPQVGDVIDVSGEAVEYFKNMQITKATWTKTGTMNLPAAVIVQPTEIARTTDPTQSPWEGVLVRVENVTVTERCVDANNRDFGNWVVTGPIFMGTQFTYEYNGTFAGTQGTCAEMTRMNDQRTVGHTFGSITGVVSYGFNDMRLEPRSAADLVR